MNISKSINNANSSEIVLSTLNAKYSHASFGLRYLRANLGEWRDCSIIYEFTIHDNPSDIVESILELSPAIVGFGVYIWNIIKTTEVVTLLKILRPDIIVIIGGPEVSYEYESTEIFRLSDFLITGEADLSLRQLIYDIDNNVANNKVIVPILPILSNLKFPYNEYSDNDLANRLLYVEASRGCPFRCEFCLSSLEIPVRTFDIDSFLLELQLLITRGARSFKFVDRTFNLNIQASKKILEFCLNKCKEGFELHFEMIPDRLPQELKDILIKFPPDMVQLEIGIQTTTKDVSKNISRPINLDKIKENFEFLKSNTNVHIHADLIAGMPGESLETFAESFNTLIAMEAGEIQVGILKKLKGTPIKRHINTFAMRFSSYPTYEILETDRIDFFTMQNIKRFARYFELYYNSAQFVFSMKYLLSTYNTPFDSFWNFSIWLYKLTEQTHQFALSRLYKLLFDYLLTFGHDPKRIAPILIEDYDRYVFRKERLEFLRPYVDSIDITSEKRHINQEHQLKMQSRQKRTGKK